MSNYNLKLVLNIKKKRKHHYTWNLKTVISFSI